MRTGAELDVDALVARWRGPLVGWIASWDVPHGEAIELAQDVLAEAYLARGRFRGDPDDERAMGPWLAGIARNLRRARARARARRRAMPLEENELAARSDGHDDGLEPLRAAIARLPEALAAVVRMHYLEETPVRDVAALLGLSEKAVEGRMYRARAELRRALATAQARGAGVERR